MSKWIALAAGAAIAYAVVATTGPCSVTASAAAGTTFIDVVAHEISGVDTFREMTAPVSI